MMQVQNNKRALKKYNLMVDGFLDKYDNDNCDMLTELQKIEDWEKIDKFYRFNRPMLLTLESDEAKVVMEVHEGMCKRYLKKDK